MIQSRKIRVLVVDDSPLIRRVLEVGLNEDPGIEVVGTASDPYAARDKILELHPDVMTLDVEMPRMDGVEFLRRLMPQYPMPVVMLSALTQKGAGITLDALEAGATDFVSKPSPEQGRGIEMVMQELITKIKVASLANVASLQSRPRIVPAPRLPRTGAPGGPTGHVVAIGASTGGTEALRTLLSAFPADMPGMVVVQHMPSGFTRMFAERLNTLCNMEVAEAKDGDRILQGRILIAPGGMQMRVRRSGGIYSVECAPGDKVSGHCPSVDVLMASVAESAGAAAVGVILTGMGHDGSDGLLAMRRAGARTVAQDEATSVVFGMPKVAFEKGGAECLQPLNRIAAKTMGYLGR